MYSVLPLLEQMSHIDKNVIKTAAIISTMIRQASFDISTHKTTNRPSNPSNDANNAIILNENRNNHNDSDNNGVETILSPPMLRRAVATCWLYFPGMNHLTCHNGLLHDNSNMLKNIATGDDVKQPKTKSNDVDYKDQMREHRSPQRNRTHLTTTTRSLERRNDKRSHDDDMTLSPPILQRTVASCWLYFPYSNHLPPNRTYYTCLPQKVLEGSQIDSNNHHEKAIMNYVKCPLNWLHITKLLPTSGSYEYNDDDEE